MVPADSHRIPRVPRYSGYRYASYSFVYATFMLCGLTFQTVPLGILLAISRSYYPREAGTSRVWAAPRSLATTGGITNLFSFPAGTKMFQFPAFASPERRCPVFNRTGCPIRKSAGQGSFAPHRGLSQLITSFIACKSLGIRHSPLPTFARTYFMNAAHSAASLVRYCILSAVRL